MNTWDATRLIIGAAKLKLALPALIVLLCFLGGVLILGVVTAGSGGEEENSAAATTVGIGLCSSITLNSTSITPTVNLDGPAGLGYDGKGHVHPLTQFIAEDVKAKFGLTSIGGVRADKYPYHPSGRAADLMVYDDTAKGDKIAEYLIAHWSDFNLYSIIWKQRYWNGHAWEGMEDRGSKTANHFDHVHVDILEDTPEDFAPCTQATALISPIWGGLLAPTSIVAGVPMTYVDDYPKKNWPVGDCTGSTSGGCPGECTDFVGWRLNQILVAQGKPKDWFNGNAGTWKSKWEARGWPTSNTPGIGAVAWYAAGVTWSGSVGHVAFVREVSADGRYITVEQYNVPMDQNGNVPHAYSVEKIDLQDKTRASRIPSGYLYLPK